MNYLFTSESVSEGHPDKVADQISDAILDEFLARDPQSKVACETLVTTGQVVVAGEIKSEAYVDMQDTARRVINEIGYDRSDLRFDGNSCGVLLAVHEQSADINRGVERAENDLQGAGDQGMMFGYATNETPLYIPLTLALSHGLLMTLAEIRREGVDMTYLRPDAKSQVTVEYDENDRPVRVNTIVVSTQHDEFVDAAREGISQEEADERMLDIIRRDVRDILIPRMKETLPEDIAAMLDGDFILHVNPTGKFVIGGPHGDTGLTGRKIIVDTYGGHGAKNLVAAGVADRVLVQVAYAIGVAAPVSLCVNTYGTSHVGELTDAEIAARVEKIFDMRPYAIEQRLKLRNPIYRETASYGHVGRTPRTVVKTFTSHYEAPITREVELFTWEKLDAVDAVREAFSL